MKITFRHITAALLSAFIIAAGVVTLNTPNVNATEKPSISEKLAEPVDISPSKVQAVLNEPSKNN